MKELEKILENNNLNYEMIKEYIDMKKVEIWNRILGKINLFDEESRKLVCMEIIKNTNDINLINNVCMEIITFIEYDYHYYKEIVTIIVENNEHDEMWIEEMKLKLLEDHIMTIQECFDDFSNENPLNVKYDIAIIVKFLERYNEKYLTNINLDRKKVLLLCDRLNDILTINVKNILNLYFYYDKIFSFDIDELNIFFNRFVFNFPSICEDFIEKNNIEKSSMFDIMREKIKEFKTEQKIKFDMEIFKPTNERYLKYRKQQIKQNTKVNNLARSKSLFWNMCKSNTILYGKKYGIAVQYQDKREMSINKMHEFAYEYPFPYEYLLDPVEYMHKINDLKSLNKE